jgi:hypothetical protein
MLPAPLEAPVCSPPAANPIDIAPPINSGEPEEFVGGPPPQDMFLPPEPPAFVRQQQLSNVSAAAFPERNCPPTESTVIAKSRAFIIVFPAPPVTPLPAPWLTVWLTAPPARGSAILLNKLTAWLLTTFIAWLRNSVGSRTLAAIVAAGINNGTTNPIPPFITDVLQRKSTH